MCALRAGSGKLHCKYHPVRAGRGVVSRLESPGTSVKASLRSEHFSMEYHDRTLAYLVGL
jgi:hypothetical protein